MPSVGRFGLRVELEAVAAVDGHRAGIEVPTSTVVG